MVDFSRRRLLQQGLCGLSVYGAGAIWSNLLIGGCSDQQSFKLLPADANGVRLPAGYTSRIVARSSQPVLPEQTFLWHAAPDGGACFAAGDGGWIYVSNSEVTTTGGAGAIRFDAAGNTIDAYAILQNTSRNCAGGTTPWGSWLSCEEIATGRVWECDPAGKSAAVVRPALGVFNHEAVAVDEKNRQLYLTEDNPDGCLYRFTAENLGSEGHPDLSAGVLEVAVAENHPAAAEDIMQLSWLALPDPQAETQETRHQIPSAMRFNGGEGIAYYNDRVIFSTKGDNRIWSYHTATGQLKVLYDASSSLTPILTGVDNVTVSAAGDIYVAEDGGDLQIVVIDNRGSLSAIAQLEGHEKSEVTGLAFSPDGKRLYFSSQRGTAGVSESGITYEIQGF
jgi:secreted PhoX family phosphatase